MIFIRSMFVINPLDGVIKAVLFRFNEQDVMHTKSDFRSRAILDINDKIDLQSKYFHPVNPW